MGKRKKKKKKWKNKSTYVLPESFVTSEEVNMLAHRVFGSLYYNSSSDIGK